MIAATAAAAAGIGLLYLQHRRHQRAVAELRARQRIRDAIADAGHDWPDHERARLFRPRLRVEGDGSPAA